MGIRFYCPNGHKLNVKEFQAGRKGICPHCGASTQIPLQSTRGSSKREHEQPLAQATSGGVPPAAYESRAPSASAGVTVPVAGGAGGGAAPAPSPWPATAEAPTIVSAAQVAPIQASPVQSAPARSPSAQVIAPQIASASAPGGAVSSGAAAQAAPAGPPPAAPPAGGGADALAEAGDVVWYVRPPSGGQFGPAGRDVMREWVAENRVNADSLVWHEGWRDWRQASDVFPQLSAGSAADGLEAILSEAAAYTATTVRPHHAASSPKKSRANQIVIIAALAVAVLTLIAVFLWVLFAPS